MHTVHNIVFEIDVNHEGQHISWEQYYTDFFQNQLLPKVERLCNNWDAKYPNKKCSIDTIDINVDLDSINLEELQEKIITKINDQLSYINEKGATTNGSVRATITSLASPFEALIVYLKDGVLPAYISVKVFKEWLGSIVQFTRSEKEDLIALFITNSATIERMLSLLRNDYEKLAEILETTQKITKQYIKLEETFFKKFVKSICEKLQITYQEKQTEIWFKTLGLSSSLAQFSKTFMQLLVPKALTEKKRLVNINEHQLSVTILQAIVQNDEKKPVNISIEKIFDIISVAKAESTTKEKTTKVVDNTVDSTTINTSKDVDSKTKTSQKETSDEVNTTGKRLQKKKTSTENIEKNQITKTNQKDVSNTQNTEESILENPQKKEEENITPESLNKNNTTEKIINNTSNQKVANKNTIQAKRETTQKGTSENNTKIDQQSKEVGKLKTTNDSEETTQNNTSENKVNIDMQSKEVRKLKETKDSGETENKSKIQKNRTETTQENNEKVSEKSVDKTIFEKLSRNNIPVREIPLTTEKAGLILLNPFLARFFTGAKLVNADNEITDIGKASMLLHFLATGTETVTDVELTLEKICLGIPLDTIINYQTPLTEEDKALCEELLQAVIQHWSILKNSTANTLRDMFLKREGNLTLKEDSVKLVVERFAQDILLDKIPWNISLFRLKWMDKMMNVEW